MLQKEFVPTQESSELKALGFNEPCLKFYAAGVLALVPDAENGDTNSKLNGYNSLYVAAPTFSQVFRFFREKHGLVMVIKPIDDKRLELGYNITKNGLIIKACSTYEEAELACLRKLIELVKGGDK